MRRLWAIPVSSVAGLPTGIATSELREPASGCDFRSDLTRAWVGNQPSGGRSALRATHGSSVSRRLTWAFDLRARLRLNAGTRGNAHAPHRPRLLAHRRGECFRGPGARD